MLLSIMSCKQNEAKKETTIQPKEIAKYTIEQFHKNKNVNGGAFNNDETKLLVNSNETGIYNVFEIDIKSGQKKQITFSKRNHFSLLMRFRDLKIFYILPIKEVMKTTIFICLLKMTV